MEKKTSLVILGLLSIFYSLNKPLASSLTHPENFNLLEFLSGWISFRGKKNSIGVNFTTQTIDSFGSAEDVVLSSSDWNSLIADYAQTFCKEDLMFNKPFGLATHTHTQTQTNTNKTKHTWRITPRLAETSLRSNWTVCFVLFDRATLASRWLSIDEIYLLLRFWLE